MFSFYKQNNGTSLSSPRPLLPSPTPPRGGRRYRCMEDPSRTHPACSRARTHSWRVTGRCFVDMYVCVLFGPLLFFPSTIFPGDLRLHSVLVSWYAPLLSSENVSGSGFPTAPLSLSSRAGVKSRPLRASPEVVSLGEDSAGGCSWPD